MLKKYKEVEKMAKKIAREKLEGSRARESFAGFLAVFSRLKAEAPFRPPKFGG